MLVFAGPASVIVASFLEFPLPFETLAFVALVFGATVASVILLFGRASGAHINPAISLACLFSGGLRRRLFVPYLLFQLAGALLAGFTLWAVLGSLSPSASLGSTKLAAGVSPVEGVFLEAIGTLFLAASALSAPFLLRTPAKQAALVGATLFVLILCIGPLTGASFNPARSLGPSLFSGYFSSQLVYWVGPLFGGACAGLIFRKMTAPRDRQGTPVVASCCDGCS